MVGFIVLGLIVFGVVGFVIQIYNNLVQLRQRVKNAWSQVDVQLKRRYDLIPNLVNTVKGYAEHEKTTLENVTKARTMAMNAGTVQEQTQAENMLTGALRSLFAVAEAYPELKSNENYKTSNEKHKLIKKVLDNLQDEAKMVYNQKYNTKLK